MRSILVILIALVPAAREPMVHIAVDRIEGLPACVVVDVYAREVWTETRVCPSRCPDPVSDPMFEFGRCMSGPGRVAAANCLPFFDRDGDGDIDLFDYCLIMR